MDDTTIKEVRDLSAVLVAEIQVLVRQFEKTTGCFVHSIPVTPAAGQQSRGHRRTPADERFLAKKERHARVANQVSLAS